MHGHYGMLRILGAVSHGIIDYAMVILLAIGPSITGFRGKQATYAYVIALVLLALTLMTRYPLGVLKSIPFPAHGAIEALIAILMLALPFIANFTAGVHSRNFYFAMGLLIGIIVLLTDYRWRRSAGRASGPESAAR